MATKRQEEAFLNVYNKLLAEGHTLLCFGMCGSNLYGTASENSDEDYAAVFLPNLYSHLLGTCPDNFSVQEKVSEGPKNGLGDYECRIFSLLKFSRLLEKGETLCLDVLFSTPNMWYTTPLWEDLYDMRKEFVTKNMRAFMGYARSQMVRYSAKGDRLNLFKTVVEYLKQFSNETRLGDTFSTFPKLEGVKFLLEKDGQGPLKMVDVYSKMFYETVTVGYVVEQLENVVASYGNRAKLAAEKNGVDQKALSHAFRVCYELRELYETGDLKFPLKDSDLVKQVKYSANKEIMNDYQLLLEDLTNSVEYLAAQSSFPEKVDKQKLEKYLLHVFKVMYNLK